LLVRECKRDSGTQARYLYTTDLSLSEEVEEACCVGDRGTPRDVKALGWRTPHSGGGRGFRGTSRSSPSATSSGSWELNLRSVEAFLRFSNDIWANRRG